MPGHYYNSNEWQWQTSQPQTSAQFATAEQPLYRLAAAFTPAAAAVPPSGYPYPYPVVTLQYSQTFTFTGTVACGQALPLCQAIDCTPAFDWQLNEQWPTRTHCGNRWQRSQYIFAAATSVASNAEAAVDERWAANLRRTAGGASEMAVSVWPAEYCPDSKSVLGRERFNSVDMF